MSDQSVQAIWIKRAKRGPMDTVKQAQLIAGQGLVGNANQRGRRQVTILDAAVWEQVLRELGASLDPSERRANILVRGIDLANSANRFYVLANVVCRSLPRQNPVNGWTKYGQD